MICNYHTGQTERLSNLCLPIVAKNVGYGRTLDLECLPVEIKDKLITLLTRRGTLTSDIARKVLHAGVKILNLRECPVTNEMLIIVSKICPSLLKLDLNSLKGSRSEDLANGLLSLSLSCSNIQDILLRRCTSATDEIMKSFATHCRHLRTIDLSGCCNIFDNTLISIAKNCEELENLDVSKTQVTDEGLLQLSKSRCAVRLKEIHVTGCAAITDVSIQAIVKSCPKLHIFIFHSCQNVTNQCRVDIEMSFSTIRQMSFTVY